MSSNLKMGSIIAVLALVLTACAGGGASPRPATPAAATPGAATPAAATPGAATPGATEAAPTPEPATPEPGASPTPEPPPPAVEGTLTIWVDETRDANPPGARRRVHRPPACPCTSTRSASATSATGSSCTARPAKARTSSSAPTTGWASSRRTASLSRSILSDSAATVDSVALDAFTYDTGRSVYGLPYAAEAIALYYNTDLVPTPPDNVGRAHPDGDRRFRQTRASSRPTSSRRRTRTTATRS